MKTEGDLGQTSQRLADALRAFAKSVRNTADESSSSTT